MSLSVHLEGASGLRGRFDRIARLTFRGKSKSTDVYEQCSEPSWDDDSFEWELQGNRLFNPAENE